ncbi:hypothetical protein BKA60DRAFT_664516 [Fusarium oxysporum]|nr:hypothetical protein BKA60DRAFT_664516 [Fusarium oxysporum]
MKCDGYLPPKPPKPPRRRAKPKAAPAKLAVVPLGYPIHNVPSLISKVCLYFQHFRRLTSPVHDLGDPNIDEIQSFIIQQYNKTILSIIPSITASSTENLHIIMICCLLFISFEGLTSLYDEVLKHLKAGSAFFHSRLLLLTIEDRLISEKLIEMFCTLEVELSKFMPPISDTFGIAKTQSKIHVLYNKKPWYYECNSLMAKASESLQKSLDEGLSAREEQQYDKLCLRQKYWQMVIDSYARKDDESGPTSKVFGPSLVAARKPTYLPDRDLISGLTFIASATKDEEIEVQALDLLWRLNRREGLLDSRDVVEMHELSRSLSQLTGAPTVDKHWEPKAAAGTPSIIERFRKYLGR